MVKEYFKRGGTWQYSHNNATLSNYTTVNVGFLRDGNKEDETQFDILYCVRVTRLSFVLWTGFQGIKRIYKRKFNILRKMKSA